MLFLLACSSADIELSFEKNTNLGSNQEESEVVDTSSSAVEEPASEPSNAAEPSSTTEPSSNTEPSTESTIDNSLCGDIPVGKDVGMCVPNLALPDITNTMVSLHDFAGEVIFLDLSDFG